MTGSAVKRRGPSVSRPSVACSHTTTQEQPEWWPRDRGEISRRWRDLSPRVCHTDVERLNGSASVTASRRRDRAAARRMSGDRSTCGTAPTSRGASDPGPEARRDQAVLAATRADPLTHDLDRDWWVRDGLDAPRRHTDRTQAAETRTAAPGRCTDGHGAADPFSPWTPGSPPRRPTVPAAWLRAGAIENGWPCAHPAAERGPGSRPQP